MAIDTFLVYVGVYPGVALAKADYELVKALHNEADLIDAYDAAVVERRPDGKAKRSEGGDPATRGGRCSDRAGRRGRRRRDGVRPA
jgi:hypothetical protein